MSTATGVNPTDQAQTALDEIDLDSPQLLKALETRQQHKEQVKAARKTFTEADGHVKALIQEHDLEDGQAARIGRFRITKKAVPSRSVQFETDPTSRLTISLIPE